MLLFRRLYSTENFLMIKVTRILPVLTFIGTEFLFEHFIGSEGFISGLRLILFTFILLGFIFLFNSYRTLFNKKLRLVITLFFVILIYLLGKMIRIYVFSHVGLDLTNFFPLILSVDGGAYSSQPNPIFDAIKQFLRSNEAQAEERASSPLPPIPNPAELQEIDQDLIWENLDAQLGHESTPAYIALWRLSWRLAKTKKRP